MNKGIIISITILFLGIAVAPITQSIVIEESNQPISNGNTLYVGGSGGGNYSTIQSAIDDANSGDTVFVYNDSSPYNETVIINKTISLVGEDRNTTVIDAQRKGNVTHITANGVNLNGFTLKRCKNPTLVIYAGVFIESNYNRIYNNNIILNSYGITIKYVHYQEIFSNNISGPDRGIVMWESNNNRIYQNDIKCDFAGIIVWESNGNKISNCTIKRGDLACIRVERSDDTLIEYTKMLNALVGLLADGKNNEFIRNHYEGNWVCALEIFYSDWCNITHSNFINNKGRINFVSCGRISFKNNYYDRPRFFPKVLIGVQNLIIWDPFFIVIPFPHILIDWRPKLIPHDI